MKLVEEVVDLRDKVEFFVDNNSQKINYKFLGKMVKSPHELYNNQEKTILIVAMRYSDDIL